MRIIRFFLFVLLIVAVCLGVQWMFGVSTETILQYYWPVAGSVLVVCFGINLLYFGYYARKIKKSLILFSEKKQYDLFVEENKKMLKKCKSGYLRGMIQINLAAAYMEQGYYLAAKEQLLAIPPQIQKRFRGALKATFLANLTYVYFYLDEQGKALQLMEENERLFDRYRQESTVGLGALYCILQAFRCWAMGNWPQAQAQLQTAQQQFPEANLEQDVAFLQAKMKKTNYIRNQRIGAVKWSK